MLQSKKLMPKTKSFLQLTQGRQKNMITQLNSKKHIFYPSICFDPNLFRSNPQIICIVTDPAKLPELTQPFSSLPKRLVCRCPQGDSMFPATWPNMDVAPTKHKCILIHSPVQSFLDPGPSAIGVLSEEIPIWYWKLVLQLELLSRDPNSIREINSKCVRIGSYQHHHDGLA
jgi:hypothetical protein